MRAVLCREFGPATGLVVGDVAEPVAGDGEVLVEVAAGGVGFVDNRIVEGQSLLNTTKLNDHFGKQVQATLPIIPGNEAAGVVLKVGKGVTRVKPGDRVLGTCLLGGFAEKAVFNELEVWPVPDNMDMHTAAGFYTAYFTAYYALIKRAQLQAGETLLVLGAGSSVGIACIEIAKAVGARVIAAASTDVKIALATQRGADAAIRYGTGPLTMSEQKELSGAFKAAGGKGGINVVADLVGGTYAEPAMRAMAFKARFLSIGFSAGIPSIPMHVIFNKNGSIIGIEPVADHRLPGENPEMMQTLLRWFAEKRIQPPVTEAYPMEQAGVALRRLADRQAAGRVVITMRDATL
jgi:NADPH:quinone reductase